jgi:transcriptional regulator with XRE-family HTH domain
MNIFFSKLTLYKRYIFSVRLIKLTLFIQYPHNKYDFNLSSVNDNLLIIIKCHVYDVLVSWCNELLFSQTTTQITAKEKKMIIRKLRLQRGWSQEQLSECSGLSIRTIQRIERGQNASVESLKSLAAVFEVDITDLTQETPMENETVQTHHRSALTYDEQEAIEYVQDIKGFYSHLTSYVCVIAALAAINLFQSPEEIWFIYPAFFWGIGIVSHGLSVFEVINLFSPGWEKKQIEKRLGRKL